MSKNTNPVLDLFKEEMRMDPSDPWGTALSAHFDIAECLYRHGADVPAEWEYSPGAGVHVGDEMPEEATELARDLDTLMRQGHERNLVHAGNVLKSFIAQCKLAGLDY